MARCLIEPLSQGGEPCAHVFRQGNQGAYRHQGEITIRPGLTSRNVEVCCLLRDPAMPTIGKNHLIQPMRRISPLGLTSSG